MTTNRILFGDSTERTLADAVIDLDMPINAIITDPPFGIAFVSNSVRRRHSEKYNKPIKDDDDPEAAIATFDAALEPLIPLCADECEMYVFTAWQVIDLWLPYLRSIPGFEVKQQLVWQKGYPGMGDINYNWGCGWEAIFYLKKGNRPVPYRRSGVISIDRIPSGKNIHPTEKPTQLIGMLVEMSTNKGDLVVDPFSGSGSTAVACMDTGRNSLGIELDAQHHKLSVGRLDMPSIFS